MVTISDSAVALRRLDYSETSQVIVFFTREHGKIRAIGKGLKRSTKTRFAVGVDLLDIGHLVISSRTVRTDRLANIVEWKQTRMLLGLREKLCRLHGAQYLAEMTSHLTEDWDSHPELYDALVAGFEELADADEPLGATVRFQKALLNSIGSMPRFDGCVLCGRAVDLTHFSSFEGGLICRHCEPMQIEKRELTPATLAALRGVVEPDARIGAFDILNYHVSHLMGREPKLAAKLVPAVRRRILP